jgi:hypothetical protein
MEVFYWVQLVGAAVSSFLLVLSVVWHRAAMNIRTIERYNEAWDFLYRSRQALLFAFAFALLALAAALDGRGRVLFGT